MASANYEYCLARVLRYEGGYVNDPQDPGGETNYGITIATARANGYTGSMRAMPLDVAKDIYRKKYWNAVNGDSLPAGLDLAVFDYGVNSGPARATSLLKSIGSDGSVSDRINRFCDARLAFLKRAVNKKGELLWPRFGKGWSNRVSDVRSNALKLAKGEPEKPKAADAPKDAGKAAGGVAAGGAVVVGTGAAVQAGWSWGEIAILLLGLLALAGFIYCAWRWWQARKDSRLAAGAFDTPSVPDTPIPEKRLSESDQATADDLAKGIAAAATARTHVAKAAEAPRRKSKKASTVKRRAVKRTAKKRRA